MDFLQLVAFVHFPQMEKSKLVHNVLSLYLQLSKYMWVDNSRTSARQLYDALPSLLKILEDATHVMRRIFDVIPDGHSAKGEHN
jgi:hypothetical protein